MNKAKSGNLNNLVNDHPETKNWVVGHFIKHNNFLKTDDLEVKWAVHKKGDIKDGNLADYSAKTLGF
ncbi:hypothetical protein KKB10_00235 [Patescibacteria group bacterium]|nr:hypothetical protein [Patescibacteria group bacterium]MBU1951810.1 hypothetical protein [Patescibacteria group bacterium]